LSLCERWLTLAADAERRSSFSVAHTYLQNSLFSLTSIFQKYRQQHQKQEEAKSSSADASDSASSQPLYPIVLLLLLRTHLLLSLFYWRRGEKELCSHLVRHALHTEMQVSVPNNYPPALHDAFHVVSTAM